MTKKESQEKILKMLNDYNTAIKGFSEQKKDDKNESVILLTAVAYVVFQDVCEAIGIEFEKENYTLNSVKNWGFIAE